MRVVADLHIHSPYSRATSQEMDFRTLDEYAKIKGIDIIGTGDFTHPKRREEIKTELCEAEGLYSLKEKGKKRFIVTGEVCTSSYWNGRNVRIHHLIILPSVEVAEQVSEELGKKGDLKADGRPMLMMSGAELVDTVMSFDEDNMIVPAHIWTPWFSLFGDRGGVNRIEECYEDQTPHIYSVETGLSSDPPMNWRVSELDRLTLISNSDSHSPAKVGREANIFEVGRPTYKEIVDAIRFHKDKVATIEVEPAFGKYHWTGHRACGISVPPEEAVRMRGICPVCGKRMTKGVAERVEELADRAPGVTPPGAQQFFKVLPLMETIAVAMGRSPSCSQVEETYWKLLAEFGDEISLLLFVPVEKIKEKYGVGIAEAIELNRMGKIEVTPGYDGVYGRPTGLQKGDGGAGAKERFFRRMSNLEDYIQGR
ncbi:MAG: endonuclease Q family protein [Candidatus Verstraetearchaeota archaeon]|nr:endonuclease Q family protein [Candidatus Verstraetearchaeota archaeon]